MIGGGEGRLINSSHEKGGLLEKIYVNYLLSLWSVMLTERAAPPSLREQTRLGSCFTGREKNSFLSGSNKRAEKGFCSNLHING